MAILKPSAQQSNYCGPSRDDSDADGHSAAKGITKTCLIVGADVSKVARGRIWAPFYSAAWNFINKHPAANTILSAHCELRDVFKLANAIALMLGLPCLQ